MVQTNEEAGHQAARCPFWIVRVTLLAVGLILMANLFFNAEIRSRIVPAETSDAAPVVIQSEKTCDCSGCPTKKTGEFKVPNIVHYTWYAHPTVEMTFKHYIGVLSASKILKPDKIYIHMNISRPAGEYWDKIIALPNVEPRNEGIPKAIWDRKIVDNATFFTDYSDISRLRYLVEYGGIYLDYDVFVVRSFDDLRKYDFVLGQEQEKEQSYDLLSNGVIVASKDSPFLAIWGQSYEDDYQPRRWVYNACFKPTRLWKRFPQFIHVEKYTIHRPNWREIDKLWGNDTFDWKSHYAVHNFYRFRHKATWYKENYGDFNPDEESIHTMNNTYGAISRWILSL